MKQGFSETLNARARESKKITIGCLAELHQKGHLKIFQAPPLTT